MKIILINLVLIFAVTLTYSQDDELLLGSFQKLNNAALYDLSDPNGINMDVNLWGFIKYPGKYRIPVKSTFLDLISYSGGPNEESNLKEIRILRNSNDPGLKPEIIKLNYEDLLWEEKISATPKINPVLQPGDIVLVMREKRYSFREDIGFYLPIFSTIVAITTLIITITNK